MKIGIHENYQGKTATTLARTASRFPLMGVTREFEANALPAQDLVKRMVARCQPAWDAGKTAVWSFKPRLQDVVSGAWQPYILTLGQYIKDKGLQDRVVVVIWHEPENDFTDPAEFVTLFNIVHDLLMRVDPTIVTSHAALGYYYRNISVEAARRWTTKATIDSIDLYSGRSFPIQMTLGTSTAFQTWKQSRPAGRPWGVSERGWIANADMSSLRVQSIWAETDWLMSLPAADRPAFYCVWNTVGTENDPLIVLDKAGESAVNYMFQKLSTLAGTTPAKPVGTPPAPGPAASSQCPMCKGSGTADPGTWLIAKVG